MVPMVNFTNLLLTFWQGRRGTFVWIIWMPWFGEGGLLQRLLE